MPTYLIHKYILSPFRIRSDSEPDTDPIFLQLSRIWVRGKKSFGSPSLSISEVLAQTVPNALNFTFIFRDVVKNADDLLHS